MIPGIQPITPAFSSSPPFVDKVQLPSETSFTKNPNPFYTLQKREELLRHIRFFLRLPENWDGYGAPSLDRSVYESAEKILKYLPDRFLFSLNTENIVPTATGTIEIEWIRENRSFCLDVGDNSASAYGELPDSSLSLNPEPLETFLEKFRRALEEFYDIS